MRRRLLTTVAIGVVCATTAASALGDGSRGPGAVQGWDGIARGGIRYVAVPAGDSTAIEAVSRQGGRVLRFIPLKGNWGIPMVAYDGTTDGLLPDGHTLLVSDANTGPSLKKQSSFALLNMRKIHIIHTVRLAGDFSFDALSPDARYLYLVEHLSTQNLTQYRVRAYDFRAGRLLPNVVTDKRESETTMQGYPVTRATSPNGRWAYTLYGGSGKTFIHALDTRNVGAVCIDLPWRKQPKRLFQFKLRLDGDGHIVVRGPRGRALVVVDRAKLRVLSSVREP